jgi:hypothetical protein
MLLRAGLGVLVVVPVLAGCASGSVPSGTGGGGTGGSTTASGTGGSADPCEAMQCGEHAACAVVGGSPVCQCDQGWVGDGVTCTDVDECASNTATCDAKASCANTPGAYTCTCTAGYQGDGMTCTDVDECADNTATCAAGMVCHNIPGGYQCACAPGYITSGGTCVDINECVNATATCHADATCTNTPGAYTCACKAGYTGDGMTCADVDECANPATCDVNATCTNTPGSHTCACKTGYAGNGTSCTPVGMGAPGAVSINAGDTTTSSSTVTLYLQEPGNLVTNPSAETGDLSGWTILQSGGDGWAAAVGDPAIHLFGQMVFITSYAQDSRSQLLDLTTLGYTQAQLDAAPPIAVREWFHGGGYNVADSYYLKVELRNGANAVLASLNQGATTTTTNATWQSSSSTFMGYGTGLRYVYFEDGGNDTEFWAGSYGASMDQASVVVGAVQMRISNDGTTWNAWQPFAPTVTAWPLSAGAGPKTVYVQYQDANNQMWPSVTAMITRL